MDSQQIITYLIFLSLLTTIITMSNLNNKQIDTGTDCSRSITDAPDSKTILPHYDDQYKSTEPINVQNTQQLPTSLKNDEIMDGDDPLMLRQQQSNFVREGDCVILKFGDGRMLFAQCNRSDSSTNYRGKKIETSVKINRRSYPTYTLIGLPYGSVLEQGLNKLMPLPSGSKIIPEIPTDLLLFEKDEGEGDDDNDMDDIDNEDKVMDKTIKENNMKQKSAKRDNRNLVDNNTAQALHQSELQKLRESGKDGSTIVKTIIENSTTYEQKTDFSRAKYVARKQMKYQPRCRIVRPNSDTICQLMYNKDSKKIMNMRNDTLAQILSYANITAGQQVLVFDTCQGIVTGSIAQRMGGYGAILSIYTGQQHSFEDMLQKFNLTWYEQTTVKWLHSSHVFSSSNDPLDRNALIGTRTLPTIAEHADDMAYDEFERNDRDILQWPCILQNHTRNYLKTDPIMKQSRTKVYEFLLRRSLRFARKLTRPTPYEIRDLYLWKRPCDSLIIVSKYNPMESLIQLFPYLSPSCPFVIYSEFIEPLCECFRILQAMDEEEAGEEDSDKQNRQDRNEEQPQDRPKQLPLAINLRLSDTWMREYQVLEGRTHPAMTMSQSGGYILTGIKLDPICGQNEIDPLLLREIRAKIGGRRQRHGNHPKKDNNKNDSNKNNHTKKKQKMDPKHDVSTEDNHDEAVVNGDQRNMEKSEIPIVDSAIKSKRPRLS